MGASPAIDLPCCLVKNWISFAGVFDITTWCPKVFPWCRLCGTCNLQMHTDIDMQMHTHIHGQTTGTSIFTRVVFLLFPFAVAFAWTLSCAFVFTPFWGLEDGFSVLFSGFFWQSQTNFWGVAYQPPKPGRWCTSRTWPCAYMVSVLRCLGGFPLEVAGSNFLWWRFSLPSVGICRVPSQQKNRGPFWYRAGICWVWWFLNIFYSSGSMLQLWSSLLQIPSRRSLSQWVELVWSLDLSRFSFLAEVDSCFPP